MAEIRFYHLERSSLERVLPKMLETALQRDWRAVVIAGSEDRVEALNALLWVYDKDGFLPHGSRKDGHADKQPVWLTTAEENPNGAHVAFLVDGAGLSDPSLFPLCCELFDGKDPDAVARARDHWKAAKAAGHEITYWQQTATGWEQKAAG
ncbi:MAG: DNA polymerase III subunit chi [Rhodospirillales bacterium]|nr:MAG: DNA polymerase III subunit chi [Rhodospirillales bacterium]